MEEYLTEEAMRAWLAGLHADTGFLGSNVRQCPVAAYLAHLGARDPVVGRTSYSCDGLDIRDLPGWATRLVARVDGHHRRGHPVTVARVLELLG